MARSEFHKETAKLLCLHWLIDWLIDLLIYMYQTYMQTIDIGYDIVYNENKIKYKNANTMGEVIYTYR